MKKIVVTGAGGFIGHHTEGDASPASPSTLSAPRCEHLAMTTPRHFFSLHALDYPSKFPLRTSPASLRDVPPKEQCINERRPSQGTLLCL